MISIEALRRAGKEVEKKLREVAKRGINESFSKLANWLEDFSNASPAFPANISVDNIAAHYSPPMDDNRRVDGRLVKVDIGAHIDGWIADAAITIPQRGFEKFARVSLECLRRAVDIIKPGVTVGEVGQVIWETAKKFGLKTIENLGGHQIARYKLHAGLFIPNVPGGSEKIEEGMVIAIEPFVTDGAGRVGETSQAFIFMQTGRRARSALARRALQIIENYHGLPFAQRWLEREMGKLANVALLELQRLGSIRAYPVLVERGGGLVSQTETTVIVEPDGAVPIVDTLSIQESLLG